MSEVKGKTRGVRKERCGSVISKSGDKSLVVLVEGRKRHPRYKKVVRAFKKFHVHDDKNEAKVGDKVVIVESRPISRMKRWRVISLID